MDNSKLGEEVWCRHISGMRALEQLIDLSGTRGESGVLLFLYHANRPAHPGELTEKLGLTTGRIANILKVLEQSGLIERTADASDRRRVQVALTPQGEEAARTRHEAAMRGHACLIDRMDGREAALREALGLLAQACKPL